jgi:hypothetical protein
MEEEEEEYGQSLTENLITVTLSKKLCVTGPMKEFKLTPNSSVNKRQSK